MEISGVSSTTANRPAAYQPTEAGAAPAPIPAERAGTAASGEAGKPSGAGFISPFLRYDQGARVAVLYFRDFDTGETQDQIPSQRVVEEYRRTASRLAQEDERKSAARQAASSGSADDSNGAGAASGSGYTPAGSGSGQPGVSAGGAAGGSFSSGIGSSGGGSSGGGSNGTTVSNSAVPTTGALTTGMSGGSYGGSPGGLVSVTV
ncbi:hypothetical protein [Azospirillum endophyticum]